MTEVEAFARKHAGQKARSKRHDITGRIVAFKLDPPVIIIEGGAGEPLRDARTHGGANVVDDARCGYATPLEYVELLVDLARYPHECPRCRAPAYVGLFAVDCSAAACK